MNQRLFSVFLFALAVAGIASLLVYRFVSAHIQAAAPTSTATVLVADHDLEVGALIHDADVRKTPWIGSIPAQALLIPQDAVGRGVVNKIYKDEPILTSRLAAQGAGAGLAATIPLGMRAVALRVNDVVGLAGFVMPGMRVDVLVVGNGPGGDANRVGTISRTVLQNLEVLSSNQKIERNSEGKPEDAQVVNLLVTPDQAEIINLASNEAKVQLVLRNPLDTKEQVTKGSNTLAMFGGSAPAPPPTERIIRPAVQRRSPPVESQRRPEPQVVEVFNGVKRSEQRFDSAEVR
jgi:pilus assembly protein CpaB